MAYEHTLGEFITPCFTSLYEYLFHEMRLQPLSEVHYGDTIDIKILENKKGYIRVTIIGEDGYVLVPRTLVDPNHAQHIMKLMEDK